MKVFLYSLLAITMLGFGVFCWAKYEFNAPGNLTEPVTLVFTPGTHFDQIADQLGEKGIIAHPNLFKAEVFLTGKSSHFRAGEYAFAPHISAATVAEMIATGKSVMHHFTIPEGLMTSEILDLVRKEPALAGEITLSLKEGELLPETYFFSYGDKRDDVLLRMKHAMEKSLVDAWAGREPGLPFTTPLQAVTLASIVEKETGLPAERPHVASVYINRLRQNMLMQADPTTAYAVTMGKAKLDRPLSLKDLALDSPYNTYKVPGLPPGPIANPGKASILATLHPLMTQDLYFVATGKGGHYFAQTVQQHEANVKKYRESQNGK